MGFITNFANFANFGLELFYWGMSGPIEFFIFLSIHSAWLMFIDNGRRKFFN